LFPTSWTLFWLFDSCIFESNSFGLFAYIAAEVTYLHLWIYFWHSDHYPCQRYQTAQLCWYQILDADTISFVKLDYPNSQLCSFSIASGESKRISLCFYELLVIQLFKGFIEARYDLDGKIDKLEVQFLRKFLNMWSINIKTRCRRLEALFNFKISQFDQIYFFCNKLVIFFHRHLEIEEKVSDLVHHFIETNISAIYNSFVVREEMLLLGSWVESRSAWKRRWSLKMMGGEWSRSGCCWMLLIRLHNIIIPPYLTFSFVRTLSVPINLINRNKKYMIHKIKPETPTYSNNHLDPLITPLPPLSIQPTAQLASQ